MKIITSHQHGNLKLNIGDDIFLAPQAVHEGNITIYNGGSLAIDGLCKGVIVIEEGGSLRVGGTVEGYIFNLGGTMIIEENAQIVGKAVHFAGITFGEAYACRFPEDNEQDTPF